MAQCEHPECDREVKVIGKYCCEICSGAELAMLPPRHSPFCNQEHGIEDKND